MVGPASGAVNAPSFRGMEARPVSAPHPAPPEVRFLKLVMAEGSVLVELACHGAERLLARLDGEDGSAASEQVIALEDGLGRLHLPAGQPFCRVRSLQAKGPGGGRHWAAEDFHEAPWRWLFAPLPLSTEAIAPDVRDYGTRIAHRQMLHDYAACLGRALLQEPEAEGVALAQVTAVLCYRICDAPRLANAEGLGLAWRLLDAFRAREAKVTEITWRLSIRFACAQLGLRYGDPERCLLALEEMQPMLEATRAAPTSIRNFVKGCLLLGTLRLLREEWAAAAQAFDQAVEIAYFAPTHAPRNFGTARELADVLMCCAHCIAGRETALAKLTGHGSPSRYWDPAAAIHATLRFKNAAYREQTVQDALRSQARTAADAACTPAAPA